MTCSSFPIVQNKLRLSFPAASFVDILGKAGKINIQGEDVMKLDEFANEKYIKVLSSSGEVCAMEAIHQRTPFFAGSTRMVKQLEKFNKEFPIQ